MTGPDLFKKHKKALLARDLLPDILAFIDANSPARALTGVPANDRMHGAAVFLNEIAGHERLRALFAALDASPDEAKDVPYTFAEPEDI